MQVQDEKPYDDINITPMLDLAYVLLVIFILMCTATVQGLKVKVPQGSNTPPKSKKTEKIQSVTVNAENKIILNAGPQGTEVTIEELGAHLQQAKAQNPKVQVIVNGDSAAQYKAVVEVLTLVTQTGITQVGITTKARR